MNDTTEKKFDPRTFKILQEALADRELVFQRSLTYKKQPAKLGFVFYLIDYTDNAGRIIYQGAYQIRITLEQKLIAKSKLLLYLVWLLSHEF